MSKFINEEMKVKLQQILAKLVSPVNLFFFTQRNVCPACMQQQELLEDLAALSNKLELQVYEFMLQGVESNNYKIDKIPATAVIGKKDYGIRFYGLTAGYEFSSLIEAIMMVSTGQSDLDPQLEERMRNIKEQVHLQVFVTLTCPYCPKMVHVAHQLALVNDYVRADMVEISEFPHLVQRYSVFGVPKTVINEVYSFEGALPEAAVYLEVLKAVEPDEYRRLEEEIREIQGTRKVKTVEVEHEYEVIIIGGGPAAMSAAIYAMRKGLDVALIAKRLGGQINYTARIENYLGFPEVSGVDMTEIFRNHMERYPFAEAVGITVTQVKKVDNAFTVMTDDARQLRARAIIYCAGKEYRRLGVPGEERFIGKGIGFCATCDAPLYLGKRVAVIGGGNSAFTAVRDLLNFASEVHVIHRRKEFRADVSLVEDVRKAKNVTFYTPMVVHSFLGKDKLVGVRLEYVDGRDRLDLNVEGVFLEIGLTPNTNPLKRLLTLNQWGEIPVNRDQSTAVEGFFAAGDATDVAEKQISIAVGQGALAALTAYKYLVEKKLTKSRVGAKESWQ